MARLVRTCERTGCRWYVSKIKDARGHGCGLAQGVGVGDGKNRQEVLHSLSFGGRRVGTWYAWRKYKLRYVCGVNLCLDVRPWPQLNLINGACAFSPLSSCNSNQSTDQSAITVAVPIHNYWLAIENIDGNLIYEVGKYLMYKVST